MRLPRAVPLAGLLLAGSLADAAASEDTDTPGAGNWEINLGISGQRTAVNRQYVAPNVEFNYGWGERAQAVLAIPHVLLREPGVDPRSGLGSATIALKWRLLDQEQAGLALAVFPACSWNLSSSAARQGLADRGRSLVLPLVAGLRHGDTGLFVEAGRNLLQEGPDKWLAGVRLTRQCLASVECRVELEHSRVQPDLSQTLASVGFKWHVATQLIVQGSVGRDLGAGREDKRQLAFMFGVQLLR